MGARTLVAIERDADGYDLHRSQWGGEHVDRLVDLVRADEAPPDLVDPEPFRSGVSADELLDSLDPREFEAFVVADDRTEAYLVCRLGIETGREAATADDDAVAATGTESAALVPWPGEAAAERLRRFVRTAKDLLGDAVDAGLVPAPAATQYLAVRIARHPDTPDPAAILWVEGGGPGP
ncbi:hypothetical protein C475_18208 [Halosimplex carlsbadense 2-9-1]|uniref:Uncharacterized protein n=1 Tax=Halosimplex carlsbadense 2-9-1 TaxID=797114 RepID=M0CJD5_9EURY|nr:DUF6735 family protein [Halosimplex carlsbadense]ELZ22472.1 hypothetical protein C475_18208 [Halosimplex carlsbadense 2-9-1]